MGSGQRTNHSLTNGQNARPEGPAVLALIVPLWCSPDAQSQLAINVGDILYLVNTPNPEPITLEGPLDRRAPFGKCSKTRAFNRKRFFEPRGLKEPF